MEFTVSFLTELPGYLYGIKPYRQLRYRNWLILCQSVAEWTTWKRGMSSPKAPPVDALEAPFKPLLTPRRKPTYGKKIDFLQRERFP